MFAEEISIGAPYGAVNNLVEGGQVTFVDLYCKGDYFLVITTEVATGDFGYYTTSPPDAVSCDSWTADPETALATGFSSLIIMLPTTGNYTFQMIPLSSPYGGGTASMRYQSGPTRKKGEPRS